MYHKLIVPPTVRSDPAGDGHFHASRGSRKHNGIDYVCTQGSPVFAPEAGKVSKLGYPYADDLSWRYVEITDSRGSRHRLFYVNPLVSVGDPVGVGQQIGIAQDVSLRYPDQAMTPHVHYEIIHKIQGYVNPEGYS